MPRYRVEDLLLCNDIRGKHYHMSNMKPDHWSYLALVIGHSTGELYVVVHLFVNNRSYKREDAFIVDERIILHMPFLPFVGDSE
jgi:hypothetical protein